MNSKNHYSIFLIILIFLSSCIRDQIPPPESFPTISGKEDTTLVNRIDGYLIYEFNGTVVKSLPNLKERYLNDTYLFTDFYNPTFGSIDIINGVSGPDEEGNIVYFTSILYENYTLMATTIDGKEPEVIFTRKGDSISDIGNDVALSPRGGYAAFVSNLQGIQTDMGYLQEGTLEIWDVINKKKLDLNVKALANGLAWFPDGKILAYTKLISQEELKAIGINIEDSIIQKKYLSSENITVVYVYDLSQKTDKFLSVGEDPVISDDGKKFIIFNGQYSYLFDIDTKESKMINLPGRFYYYGSQHWSGPIAFISPNLVLYRAVFTEGAKPQWTTGNSPLVGPKPLVTIKLTDLDTGQFQTIVEGIDPRHHVGYGNVKEGKI